MKIFCNLVGFPIVKHEAQCLALFRLLEQECLKVTEVLVPKRLANSGSQGHRELKGLISNVNYDGVSSKSRSRVSSTAVGVVGSCNLLSWNVRGLNNPRKREVCKNLLKDWKCDIVCFQETKVSSTDVAFVWSLRGSPFIDWAVLDAVQALGGVLLIWWMTLFGLVQVCMAPMMMVYWFLCGRSCLRCVPDGPWHGV